MFLISRQLVNDFRLHGLHALKVGGVLFYHSERGAS